ncbi:MAG: RNA polymerase sigma factor [Flavobacteriales bacterium]|nr:RNA polymerase sigma factor [Flavobacteriales bacterium]PIV92684.1 MAG: RNA polymerase subunit sigma-70 [Flavobacteriaceae bacterium CG17_big_fil_post_rev_8_21_14_2_50_33_15]PIY11146.1 MAG: RNA polymerase subunit sigma-70 [Flavobacteriaceae bacterium CG_4_10_14_3_um_filter_33_47]PJB17831.1 MAG: RNA polymerase subunit sigma-70 [Flavobacteriaceae bacterium CG_4_9_14_3_um_filter_33_16]NCQ13564.1 RNA polymerase sigma factor [Flavobacteriales bacterium]
MNRDTELIKKLKNPELKNEAFKDLLDLYQERLYWHIRKIVITHDNANDVLQETFIRIFRGMDSFKEKSSLHTWMYKIAYNESLRFIEKNKLQTSVSIEQDHNTYIKNLTQDEFFNGNELQLKFNEIISKLPSKQQRVFQMKYFDDLSFREISDLLDISENTLKSAYYTAVKTIEDNILAEC